MAHDPSSPTVSVVVPSFRRPESLRACLAGLGRQRSAADEVLVVVRQGDLATAAALRAHPSVATVEVEEPGVVVAMRAGASAARSQVIAFCDDDAVPRPDWVLRIRAAFADPRLGALGGRDHLAPPHPEYPPTDVVGRLRRSGRMIGDHHRGTGPSRDVDVLKAVTMAFRREALTFPRGLRGTGAQVHFEVPICCWAQADGWRVRYDPALVVDHDPKARFDADRRDRPEASAVRDAAYNLTLGVVACRPDIGWRRPAYGALVGDRGTPGVVRAGMALARRDAETVRRLLPSLQGQWAGWRAARRAGSLERLPLTG